MERSTEERHERRCSTAMAALARLGWEDGPRLQVEAQPLGSRGRSTTIWLCDGEARLAGLVADTLDDEGDAYYPVDEFLEPSETEEWSPRHPGRAAARAIALFREAQDDARQAAARSPASGAPRIPEAAWTALDAALRAALHEAWEAANDALPFGCPTLTFSYALREGERTLAAADLVEAAPDRESMERHAGRCAAVLRALAKRGFQHDGRRVRQADRAYGPGAVSTTTWLSRKGGEQVAGVLVTTAYGPDATDAFHVVDASGLPPQEERGKARTVGWAVAAAIRAFSAALIEAEAA